MANRFRSFVESIVFAGMKPGARSSEDTPAGEPGLLARLFAAPAPSDPLYLTNQTFGQKARRILLLAAPVVVVVAAVVVAILLFGPKSTKAPKELTAAEVAAKLLPDFNKEIKLDSNKDLEVLEVHFEHTGGNFMLGSIRNATGREIAQAVVVFDLADVDHSNVGGVTVTETELAPGAVRSFKQAIEQTTAVYGVVREVQTR